MVTIETTTEPEAFTDFLLSLGKETMYYFSVFEEEINNSTVNSIVEKDLSRSDKLRFFAFENDVMVGYGFLVLAEKPAKKHTCSLGIVVGDKWQGKGYGKALIKYMVDFAWKHGISKVWLEAYSDNSRAVRLYNSVGFQIEGIFMGDLIREGREHHIVTMAMFGEKGYDRDTRLRIWKSIEQ